MQTINFTQYNTRPSFGALKIKGVEGMQYIKKYSPDYVDKLDDIKKELSKHNYWDLIVDEDGYKLAYSRTKKIYTVPFKPKKVLKDRNNPRLLIRTSNSETMRKTIISFPAFYDTLAEVKAAYHDIVHSKGLERMVLIVKALEKHH